MDKQPIQMKSSQQSKSSQTNQEPMPQFACAIYIDNDGMQKLTYNIIGNYPKHLIMPGLLSVAGHVKLNLLDKLQPGEDDDRLYGVLKDMAEAQVQKDEVKPESGKVLRLDTLPTKEEE